MKKLLTLATVLTLASQVIANDTEAIDPQQVNQEQEVIELSASEQVEKAFEEYAEKKDIYYGEEKNGKTFYSAKAVVNANPTNPQWGKLRFTAFERAMLNIRSQFVTDTYGRVISKRLNEAVENNGDDAEEFTKEDLSKSKFKELLDKAIAYGGAKLDKLLNEEGIDPKEFNSQPKEERKVILMNKLSSVAMTKAIGSSTGLMITQTFEGKDSSGNHVIGIVAMYSPKIKQLAYDISKGREPLLKKKTGKKLRQQIPADSKVLKDTFGTRILFDENGRPAIISYGQWSHNHTGKSRQSLERKRLSAQEKAKTKANVQIAEFLSSNIMYQREEEDGEVTSEELVKKGDFITREEVVKVIDKFTEKLRSQASAKLAGIRTLKRWSHKTANGIEIIGEVRAWTIDSLEASKKIKNWKPSSRRSSTNTSRRSDNATGVSQGADQIDVDDF